MEIEATQKCTKGAHTDVRSGKVERIMICEKQKRNVYMQDRTED